MKTSDCELNAKFFTLNVILSASHFTGIYNKDNSDIDIQPQEKKTIRITTFLMHFFLNFGRSQLHRYYNKVPHRKKVYKMVIGHYFSYILKYTSLFSLTLFIVFTRRYLYM